MKIGGLLFGLGTAFYFIVAGLYWIFSRDQIGTTVLVMTGCLAFLVTFYVSYTSKRLGSMPEDRLEGEIDEADPEYGFFSPNSWWPLMIGFAAFVIGLGLIFATWVIVLGVFLLLLGLIGWLFEYYRRDFAH